MRVEKEKISPDQEEYARLYIHEETENIQHLCTYIETDAYDNQFLTCTQDGAVCQIPFWEILYIEAAKNGQQVYTKEENYLSKKPLYQLEKILPETFIRVSKGAILNTRAVTRYVPEGGLMRAEFNPRQWVYISRRYLKTLRQQIKEGW